MKVTNPCAPFSRVFESRNKAAKVAQVCLEGDTERTQTAANNKRRRADLYCCNQEGTERT